MGANHGFKEFQNVQECSESQMRKILSTSIQNGMDSGVHWMTVAVAALEMD